MKAKTVSVGQLVQFTPNENDAVAKSNGNTAPIAALVTRVWEDGSMVNLKIFPDCGPVEDRGSVPPKSKKVAAYFYE